MVRMNLTNEKSTPDAQNTDRSWLELVRKQVASLRFGTLQLVVHDSRVVQIERTEKVRLDHPHNDPSTALLNNL
jgi:hypothetical protein